MAGQQTALGDTIGLAIKTLETSAANQKVMILLTDGNDTASRVPPEHAADIAQQNSVMIYTIAVGDPAASDENRVDLATLKAVAQCDQGTILPCGGRCAVAGDLCRDRPARAGEAADTVVASTTSPCSSGRWARQSFSLWRCGSACWRQANVDAGGLQRMFDIATIPFHFLRPLWLFALLPVAAVVLLVHRRESIAARWGGVIAPQFAEKPDCSSEPELGHQSRVSGGGRNGARDRRHVGTNLAP